MKHAGLCVLGHEETFQNMPGPAPDPARRLRGSGCPCRAGGCCAPSCQRSGTAGHSAHHREQRQGENPVFLRMTFFRNLPSAVLLQKALLASGCLGKERKDLPLSKVPWRLQGILKVKRCPHTVTKTQTWDSMGMRRRRTSDTLSYWRGRSKAAPLRCEPAATSPPQHRGHPRPRHGRPLPRSPRSPPQACRPATTRTSASGPQQGERISVVLMPPSAALERVAPGH